VKQDVVYLWPSGEQRLLLEAGLLDDESAIDAFRAWRERVRLEDDFSAATSRLLPLVYHNLRERGVNDPIMQRLKGIYRHSWYRTNRLLHAVEPVVAGLVSAGIPVLLTKGVPLAFSYYRNPALRPMADVDLVVPEAQLDSALGVLAGLGWKGDWPDGQTRQFRHAIQRFGPDGAELDLHWKPMYESGAAAVQQSFFRSAEVLEFGGARALQPDPTHALFLTVVHGVRWNDETPVRWIADAVTILRARGHDVRWDVLYQLATSHGVGYRLHLGLSFLAKAFRAPIPGSVLAMLAASRRSLFERFESRVLMSDDGTVRPSAIRTQMSAFAEYARHAPARNPVSFAWGYTHYLRYRLRLGGRRELLARMLKSVRRRVVDDGQDGAPRMEGRA
jgi:hypothetical protein